MIWCGRRDSNPHGFLRLDLNQVRLPFRHSRDRARCPALSVWERVGRLQLAGLSGLVSA